ncbi:MAG: hypothetical protein AB1521_01770 [Bacteroidota bacterium]
MTKVKKNVRESNKIRISPFNDYWEKSHYIVFVLGLIILILGYFLLAQNPWDNITSLSISPITLLLAYIIIFPLAILKRKSKNKTN